jgi:cell division protein FtsB
MKDYQESATLLGMIGVLNIVQFRLISLCAVVMQKEMQSKVAMLTDEVKRKAQQAAAQQDEAAQARANEAAALKKAALLEQQIAELQVGPIIESLCRADPLAGVLCVSMSSASLFNFVHCQKHTYSPVLSHRKIDIPCDHCMCKGMSFKFTFWVCLLRGDVTQGICCRAVWLQSHSSTATTAQPASVATRSAHRA